MNVNITGFKRGAARIFLEFFACLIVMLGGVARNSSSSMAYAGNPGEDTEPPVFTGEIQLINEGEIRGYARAVTVKINAEDSGSGLNEFPFSFDGGNTWQKKGEFRVTDNRRLSICLRDREDNRSGIKTIEIGNIDNIPPAIAKISAGIEGGKWIISVDGCSDNVTDPDRLLYFCIRSDDSKGFRGNDGWDAEKLIKDGGWQSDSHFRIGEGKHCIFVMDEFGNITERDLEAGHIDVEAPVFLGDPVVTNEREAGGYAGSVIVTVNAEDRDGGECYYSFDDGASWQKENSFRVNDNCVLNIRVRDGFNNTSDKMRVEISNIDRTPPSIDSMELKPLKDRWELNIIKCSDNVTSNEKMEFLCLKENEASGFANGNGWNVDALSGAAGWTGSRKFSITDGVYCVFARDQLGNITEKDLNTGILDREPPVFTEDPLLKNEGGGNGFARSVLISVKAADTGEGLNDYPFSFNNGETWQENGSMRIVENRSVLIKLRDRAGNESKALKVDVKNIDTEAPVLTLNEEKKDLNEDSAVIGIAASDTHSGVAEVSYRNERTGITVTVDKRKEGEKKEVRSAVLIREDGSYTFMARDFAGNTSSKKVTIKKDDIKGGKEGTFSASGKATDRSYRSGDPKGNTVKYDRTGRGSYGTSGGTVSYSTSTSGTGSGGVVQSSSYGADDTFERGGRTSSGGGLSVSAGKRREGSTSVSLGSISSDTYGAGTGAVSGQNTNGSGSGYDIDSIAGPENLNLTVPSTGEKEEPDPETLEDPEGSIPDLLLERAGEEVKKNRRTGVIVMIILIFILLLTLTFFLLIRKGIIVLPETGTEEEETAGKAGFVTAVKDRIKELRCIFMEKKANLW